MSRAHQGFRSALHLSSSVWDTRIASPSACWPATALFPTGTTGRLYLNIYSWLKKSQPTDCDTSTKTRKLDSKVTIVLRYQKISQDSLWHRLLMWSGQRVSNVFSYMVRLNFEMCLHLSIYCSLKWLFKKTFVWKLWSFFAFRVLESIYHGFREIFLRLDFPVFLRSELKTAEC